MAAVDLGHVDEPYADLPAPDYSDCEDEPVNEVPALHSEDSVTRVSESSLDDPTHHPSGSTDEDYDIPEPDYPSDEEDDENRCSTDSKLESISTPESNPEHPVSPRSLQLPASCTVDDVHFIIQPTNNHEAVDPVLIAPKKLKSTYLESNHKILHKELLLKHKGGQLLNTKPELVKKMDERKNRVKQDEKKKSLESKRSSLDRKMAEQAKKLLQIEKAEQEGKSGNLPEFLRVHSKIVGKSVSADS